MASDLHFYIMVNSEKSNQDQVYFAFLQYFSRNAENHSFGLDCHPKVDGRLLSEVLRIRALSLS